MSQQKLPQDTQQELEQAIKNLKLSEKIRAITLYKHLQEQKRLDAELNDKIQELTLEYEFKMQPIYAKQQELIEGRKPTDEELKDANKYSDINKEQEFKTIEDYWLKTLLNHEVIKAEIKEQDIPLLKKLRKIEYVPIDVLRFQLVFEFYPNEYFKNDKLIKTFEVDDEDEPVSALGTQIEWNQGKNTTVKIQKKTQKNKKTGAKRVVEKEIEQESFFNFFKDIKNEKAKQQIDNENEEEENKENGQDVEILNRDTDIAKALIDDIIPFSLEYYLGIVESDDEDEFEEEIDDDDLEEVKNQMQNEINLGSQQSQRKKSKQKKKDKQDCQQQ